MSNKKQELIKIIDAAIEKYENQVFRDENKIRIHFSLVDLEPELKTFCNNISITRWLTDDKEQFETFKNLNDKGDLFSCVKCVDLVDFKYSDADSMDIICDEWLLWANNGEYAILIMDEKYDPVERLKEE